jgi:hypothetical protein
LHLFAQRSRRRLFVIANAPRSAVEIDVAKCAATRAIIDGIDWPCQLFRHLSETNIGLRHNVSEGLDWVFNQTERAINRDTATAENFWRWHLDDSYARRRDGLSTWDVPWVFSCWRHEMMSIVRRTNLVAHIGFGVDAAHTKSETRGAQVPTAPMQFPLRHLKKKS